jgi:hypothetical protein
MAMNLQRSLQPAALTLALLCGLTGCHSAYIEADIKNASPTPITLVEFDYPSASFGTGTLPSGATYHYRFKILGTGPTKILWTDAARQDHTAPGPPLHEGQEGSLTVTLNGAAATWSTHLQP